MEHNKPPLYQSDYDDNNEFGRASSAHGDTSSVVTGRTTSDVHGSIEGDGYINPDDLDIDATIPFLGRWDVARIIINGTVGTGIFTAPPLVLLYTQNKAVALCLWIVGFIYSGFGMMLYLSYAKAIPYTGGELIYLDAVLPRPKLLSYTIYATTFIIVMNSATNSMQFGKQVLIARLVDDPSNEQALARFLGIVILSVVCLGIYWSNTLFRRTNVLFALLKTVGMALLIGAGIVKAVRSPEPISFGKVDLSSGQPQYALALLNVLFAFNGWENVTFVRGEIENQPALLGGFVIAWLTIGVGYLAINATFLVAIGNPTTSELTSIAYAEWLWGGEKASRVAWAIATAVSAAGSLAAISYTSSKVKQSIAVTSILPWSRLWMKEHRRGSPTPAGGLLLHWIFGVVFIAGSSVISNLDQAISFQGFLQVYVQRALGVILALGYLILPKRMKEREGIRKMQLEKMQARTPNQESFRAVTADVSPPVSDSSNHDIREDTWARSGSSLLRWLVVSVVLLCSIGICILPFIPPLRQFQRPETPPYVYPASMAIVSTVGLIYYTLCFSSPKWSIIRLFADFDVEIQPLCHGAPHKKFGFMHRVYLIPGGNFPGPIQQLLRWLFGWTINSQRDRIDPIHGPSSKGCKCLVPMSGPQGVAHLFPRTPRTPDRSRTPSIQLSGP